MNLGLHIIKNPSGTFSFVGRVPIKLAFETKEGFPVDQEFVDRQMRLPASYRSIKTKSWSTYDDALKTALDLGYEVIR